MIECCTPFTDCRHPWIQDRCRIGCISDTYTWHRQFSLAPVQLSSTMPNPLVFWNDVNRCYVFRLWNWQIVLENLFSKVFALLSGQWRWQDDHFASGLDCNQAIRSIQVVVGISSVCSQCKPFLTSRRRGRFLVNSLFRPSFIGSIGVPISLLSDNLVSAIHVSHFYLHESLRSDSANGTQSPITPSVLHSFVAAGEIFMQPSLMNPHLISTREEPFALNLWKNPNTCIWAADLSEGRN